MTSTDSRNRRLYAVIALVLVGWLLYRLAPVLTPFIAAGLLAYIADPLADRLQRLKLPRAVAVVAVFLLTFAFLGLLVLLVVPMVNAQIAALLEALPAIVSQAEQVWWPRLAPFLDVEPGEDVGFAAFIARYGEMATTWGSSVLLSVTRSGGALAAAVISLFLIPILTFYLLRDWDTIVARIGALVPLRQRDTVFRLARETDDVLGAFLRGQILVRISLGIIYSLGLTLIGLRFAIAIGVIAGLVSFVPYLGFVFGILLAGLTVALEPDPLWRLAGVVATFSIAQMIEGSFLTPKLVGNRIGLRFAIAIGVIAGLVSFVPYLGFVFGILLAGLTIALEPDPLWRLAGVVATFSIAQMIEGSFLTPKLVGNRIGLHPVLVIFAVAAGGQLFGFFGILLALPMAAVLSVLIRFAYRNYLAEQPEALTPERDGAA